MLICICVHLVCTMSSSLGINNTKRVKEKDSPTKVIPCPILFVIFMYGISRRKRGEESVRFEDLRIASLLFADNVVLLAISDRDLQHTLGWFASEGKMEWEMDRQIGTASAVMRVVHRSIVVKRELRRKPKFSIYRSIYVPNLTYGHKLWVDTDTTRLWIWAAEMSFFQCGWAQP